MGELFGIALFGLIIGIIAKLLMPGKDPGGIIITAIIGITGSLVGTWFGRSILSLGKYYQAKWIMSILGALVLLGLFRMVSGTQQHHS